MHLHKLNSKFSSMLHIQLHYTEPIPFSALITHSRAELPLKVAPFCFTRNILSARPGLNDTATYPNYIRTFLQQDPAYPSPPQLPRQRPLSKQLTSFIPPVFTTIFAQNFKGGSHKVGGKRIQQSKCIFSSRYSICLKCI